MKIISKEKDFYDYMLAYGVDESEVFVREKIEVLKSVEKGESENTINFLLRMSKFRHIMFNEKVSDDNKISYSFDFILLYFCGKIVPAISIEYKERNSNNFFKVQEKKKEFFYEEKTFLHKCSSLNIEENNDQDLLGYKNKKYLIKRLKSSKKYLNESEPLNIFNRWSHELKVSYYSIDIFKISKKRQMDDKFIFNIITNPILRDYQFSKHMDGAQVFQEIEQYLFGELKMSQKNIVEISDRDLAISKGHDGKYSFKNPPSKNRGKK